MHVRPTLLPAAIFALATTLATTVTLAAETQGAGPESSPPAAATPVNGITKEQAIAMALKAHPGDVTKAYKDTKKGRETWEVKINGTDGVKWEMYYDIKTGELVAEEAD